MQALIRYNMTKCRPESFVSWLGKEAGRVVQNAKRSTSRRSLNVKLTDKGTGPLFKDVEQNNSQPPFRYGQKVRR